ncbi:MAG TPA: NUDIX domain-containing protein [Candidatus Saccharimonadales bacterium]|nr:NUDIX domain-containing protein [Candidatus Saccharimonadales bacterium]
MIEEIVDILAPPKFEPTGQTLPRSQAIQTGKWIGTFNIWLYRSEGEPAMLYQQRSLTKKWEPGKLDVSAGGHYAAGEKDLDGLREAEEELGVKIPHQAISFWGRKLNASLNADGDEERTVLSIYTAECNGELTDLVLDPVEVTAVFWVPLRPLLEVHQGKLPVFTAQGMDAAGKVLTYDVSQSSFPFNIDNYHQRMAEHIAVKLGITV